MKSHDWTQFKLRIDIKSKPETIYHAWATGKGIKSWFLRTAEFTSPENNLREEDEFIQTGDQYKWHWHGWDDKTVEYGKVLKANGTNEIQFSFAGDCVVTVKIYKETGEHICEVTQEKIPTDEKSKVDYYIGCSGGWTFYMANLKSVLEGGLDLRNKNLALKQMVNS